MNLFILFSFLLLNNALPGSFVPLEVTNCGEQNATLSSECNTCLCSANITLCKTICEEATNNNASDVNGGGNEHVHTNQVCQPNEVRNEDCNRCKCAANGIGWFCTRRSCPPQPIRHRRQAPTPRPFQCTPGTTFRDEDDCNDCFCSKNGEALCTLMKCRKVTSTQKPQEKVSSPSSFDCTPGTTFKDEDDCNTCTCDENGRAACEEKFCLRNVNKRSIEEARNTRHCTPGRKWKKDCNDCFCTETGFGVCTLRGCLSQGSFHDSLRPNISNNSTSGLRYHLNYTPSQA